MCSLHVNITADALSQGIKNVTDLSVTGFYERGTTQERNHKRGQTREKDRKYGGRGVRSGRESKGDTEKREQQTPKKRMRE